MNESQHTYRWTAVLIFAIGAFVCVLLNKPEHIDAMYLPGPDSGDVSQPTSTVAAETSPNRTAIAAVQPEKPTETKAAAPVEHVAMTNTATSTVVDTEEAVTPALADLVFDQPTPVAAAKPAEEPLAQPQSNRQMPAMATATDTDSHSVIEPYVLDERNVVAVNTLDINPFGPADVADSRAFKTR